MSEQKVSGKTITHAWFRTTEMFKDDSVIGIAKQEWDDLDTRIDAALRRAKVEGRQEGKEYALNEAAMRAGCAAHRACCGIEADNSQGKIHGYCVVCGVPWPCETAQFFLFKADARAAQIEEGDK